MTLVRAMMTDAPAILAAKKTASRRLLNHKARLRMSESRDGDVPVVIGMGPHKRTVTIEVMTSTEQIMGHERFTTDEDGNMVMQRKEGGIVVPAGESHALEPGGDHLMFLELPEDVPPGRDVTVTLTFSDDSTMFFTAPARDFAGAEEDYDPAGGDGDTDHGGHDDHEH